MGTEKELTYREMAAAQGFCSGWWHTYGYVVCPVVYQRADNAAYWDAYEALDSSSWKSVAQVAIGAELGAREASRAVKLLVKDGVAVKKGRKYRCA